MKFKKEFISKKIIAVVTIALLFCVAIFWNMMTKMTVERERWMEVKKSFEKDSVKVEQRRGNILSTDGQLLASSLPDYNIYIDFLSGDADKDTAIYNKKDTLFHDKLDSICEGLERICPNKTAAYFKQRLDSGWKKRARFWEIYPGYAFNYIQHNELLKLPFFKERRNISGLITEARNTRNKPFGSLANRLIGEVYARKDSARAGIELAFDSLLRGKPGIKHKKKERDKFVDIIDIPAEDGYDIVTTLDVSMQDICENALREKLIELNASMGVVVLMDVKTGDVKAMVNLMQYDDGNYYEARNFALGGLYEPGSTFKTASLMVALDDGEIKMTDQVNGNHGQYKMHGTNMKDHNWSKGGYGMMDVTHTLMYSSNIGVGRLVDDHYADKPEKFVEGLRRIGIGTPLGLPFAGAADPIIRMPKADRSNWSKTALPWMAIGYETQIPPISTATFYNAIANGGKLVRPRFVKAVEKNGEVIKEYPVEVIREHICKDQTLHDVQEMLRKVVNEKGGVGKHARSKHFVVAGKTGTAQISQGKGGYAAGGREYFVSFCGYFPYENPKYTCLVAIRKPGLPASGGSQAGPVFAKISERVFSKNITTDISKAKDTLYIHTPEVKYGSIAAAHSVLSSLSIKSRGGEANAGLWGSAIINGNTVEFTAKPCDKTIMPNVVGMGARDAIFAIESRGMRARIKGRGKVKSQSLAAGAGVKKGTVVNIELD